MAKPPPKFESLKAEYRRLWDTMTFDPGQRAVVDNAAKRILSFKPRYEVVAAKTGVPWWWIGIVHNMEAGLHFGKHLHNGDSLKARTWQVPAGRPATGTPPFTWEESAEDAIRIKGLHAIREWTIERVAFEFERYNGWGYRLYHPSDLSPYLWSKTNHNDGSGKYVADGKWSATAFSEAQCGAMATLRALMDLDPSIRFGTTVAPPKPPMSPTEKQAAGTAGTVAIGAGGAVAAREAGISWETIGVAIVIVAVVVVGGFIAWNKWGRK